MLIFRASFLFAYNRSAGHNAAVDEEQGDPKSQIVAVQQCVNVGNKFLGVCFINACHLVNVVTVHSIGQTSDLLRNLCNAPVQILTLCSLFGQLIPFVFGGFAVIKRCLDGNNCNIVAVNQSI